MKALAALVATLTLAGCGVGYVQPQHDNATGGVEAKRVLLYGDSLMVSAAPEITARLAAKGMTATVINGADNGASPVLYPWPGTNHGPHTELADLLATHKPDIVIANFTGNGFAPGTAGWNQWHANITAMSSAIRDAGAVVYWTIPPYVGGLHVDADAWAAAVWYFAGLPNLDPLAAGRQPDWRTALRPVDDVVDHNGQVIGSRFAYELEYPEDGLVRTVRTSDAIHTTAAGDERLARWTTWTLRAEWGIP